MTALVRRDAAAPPMVLLCGGQNSRLQALSGTIYKPFLPLQNATLVARHITRAVLAGVRDVTVVVDHMDPLVAAHVEGIAADLCDTVCVRLLYCTGEPADKLRLYRKSTGLVPSSPVLAVLGDSYAWYDPFALVKAASPPFDSALAVASYRIPFGVVTVTDGVIVRFQEKPDSGHLINAGQMALGPAAFASLDEGQDLASVLVGLADRRLLTAVTVGSALTTVDTLSDIASAAASPHLKASP
ncbi:NDP-sugar pyrophosphorylase family protein [Catenulispora sp. GP43]|uniref:nucleotidyltransferase family protein n=1 Tax=Catenulispora sp. GP43 TaxID=3156263 RepID=UPI003515C771